MRFLLLSVLILTSLTGCFLKSLHPLFTVSDAIVPDQLEGRWETDDQRWTFVSDPRDLPDLDFGIGFEGMLTASPGSIDPISRPFTVIYEDFSDAGTDTVYFLGIVGELDDELFLDLSLIEYHVTGSDLKDSHLLPVHTFSNISVSYSELTIKFFEDQWISDLINNNQVRIKHEKITSLTEPESPDILITASTKELQKFVKKYGSDEDAYDEPIVLNRVYLDE